MEEYEPIKVLGEGSFGKVYLMKHGKTRDLVCTKVIKLKNIPPKEQEACRNEVELLRRMCHPNIVGYTDSFLYKNCLCIIMEYCDAGDLGDRVNEAKGQLLPESKVMTWFVQTALGLHYMHTNRVLHRDIKTQNVFILSSGRVVLGDLGISKLLGGTRDFASTCIGTPYYMSPEIFKNHPYNDKSDVWALGCLLYELLTLKHAFDAQSLNGLAGKIIKGKFPSVSSQYSKNLRALVNDMLATNPKKRPDIEQILRKEFVQTRVKEFVGDLDANVLHRQDKAMSALSDQLIDLRMDDAVPLEHLIVEDDEEDESGPNAPSPSKSAAQDATAATIGDSRSQLKAQKHQLELEEEKRIAAEMALNRLRRKAAERRRRASLSRSNSPMADGGVGRIGSGGASPRSPGSPDNGSGRGEGLTSRSRRPSLMQRLGNLASSPLQGRRRSLSTPGSPSGATATESPRGPATARGRRGSGAAVPPGMSDLDKAMALAVAAAEQIEAEQASGGAGGAGGGAPIVKGPTGPPPRSLARPKEATDYVSNPSPRRRSKSGVNTDCGGGDTSESTRATEETRRSQDDGPSPQRRVVSDLPKLPLGNNSSAAPALRSGRSSARDYDESGGSPRGRRSKDGDSVFEEDEGTDLFCVLKEQTKAHARQGEDKEVHEREEELRAMLKEAEDRCRELQQNMDKVRQAGGRRGSQSAQPPPAPTEPAALEAMGLPQINIEVNPVAAGSSGEAGARARRGSYSRSASSVEDDQASDFEDEPVPYCQSHLEGIRDAPTPVGNLVDRVQFLRKTCAEGLGEEKFEKALDLLQRMQQGDCKVTVEGTEYDGNDDDDVEKVLIKVIGKHKLHYWNLIDQLLLMS